MSYHGFRFGQLLQDSQTGERFRYSEYQGWVYRVYETPTTRPTERVGRPDNPTGTTALEAAAAGGTGWQAAQPPSSSTRTASNARNTPSGSRTDQLTRDLSTLSVSPPLNASTSQYRDGTGQPSSKQTQARDIPRQSSSGKTQYRDGGVRSSDGQGVVPRGGSSAGKQSASASYDASPTMSARSIGGNFTGGGGLPRSVNTITSAGAAGIGGRAGWSGAGGDYGRVSGEIGSSYSARTGTRSAGPSMSPGPLTWAFGQVIEVHEARDVGENSSGASTVRPAGQASRTSMVRVQRYVIVDPPNPEQSTFVALRIKAYSTKGIPPEYPRARFAPIYTGRPLRAPAPYPTNEENQLRLLPNGRIQADMRPAVLVEEADVTQPLDPYSRLEYTEAVRLQCDPRMRYYGRVHPDYQQEVRWAYQAMRDGGLPTGGNLPTLQELRVEVESDGAIQEDVVKFYLIALCGRARSRGMTEPQGLHREEIQDLARRSDRRRIFFDDCHNGLGM